MVKKSLKNFYVLAPHTPDFYDEGGQTHKIAITQGRVITSCWFWCQTNQNGQVY